MRAICTILFVSMLCYALFLQRIVTGSSSKSHMNKQFSNDYESFDLVTSEIFTAHDRLECLYGNARIATMIKAAFVNVETAFLAIQSGANTKIKKTSTIGDFNLGISGVENIKINDRRDDATYLGIQSGRVLICCGSSQTSKTASDEATHHEETSTGEEIESTEEPIDEKAAHEEFAEDGLRFEPVQQKDAASDGLFVSAYKSIFQYTKLEEPKIQHLSELCQQLLSITKNCKNQTVSWSPQICNRSEQSFIEFC